MTEDKKRGYISIVRRHHKYAGTRGRIYLHRYLKELDLGYYLTPEYDIHHKNGNKHDNSPENLEVLLKGDHTREHNPVIDMTNRRCVICGIKYEDIKGVHKRHWYENATVCFNCYVRNKRNEG